MYILIEINFKVECSKNTHVACQSLASIVVTCDLTTTELHVRCGYQRKIVTTRFLDFFSNSGICVSQTHLVFFMPPD